MTETQPTCQIQTRSPEETERLGATLAALTPPGSVLALHGDLAAGKTCLVRGMAAYTCQGQPIHSPTFTLVNQYGPGPYLNHIDLYRIASIDELAELGWEELLEPAGITVIEWAERAGNFLPSKRLDIFLEHAGEDLRQITFVNHGLLPTDWQIALTAQATQ